MAENKTLPVGCVIMASGLSTRFGSNKLLTPFGPGREPMLRRAFAATDTPLLASRVVVARSPEVETLCREVSVSCLLHALPGRNDTVRLGLEALLAERPDLAGCMFLPGDQPLLRRESVESLLRAFAEHLQTQKETERMIFRLAYRAKDDPTPLVGSPVLFDSGYFPALRTLPEARVAVFCSGSIRNRYIVFIPLTTKSCGMPTPRKPCRSWKRCCNYSALSSFGSSRLSTMATKAAGTMPDSPQMSWMACGVCARMLEFAPMP